MTELEIIKKQFIDFYTYSYSIPIVKNYLHPNFRNDSNCIGEKTSKFTMKNYIDRYREILNEEFYQIIFQDESIISFYYKFDEIGNVTQHNLSFIPSIDSDIDIEEYDYSDKNVMLLLIKSFTDYIRIDFDKEGYQEILHCENHAHIGLKERRDKHEARKEIRFPVRHVIYPYDFIYIICKYVYQVTDKCLDVFISESERRCTLTETELKLLNVSIN